MNTEDSIHKTTKPSFDVQIVILLCLQLNSPYTLCRKKGKLSRVMENGRLLIFTIVVLFPRSYQICSNSVFIDGSRNSPVWKCL
ncbi:hypothetical protein MXB_3037 [Myxobolus squamalis]|nr:hypothetical protein MXB_3037 [Myxobolus squamalis]